MFSINFKKIRDYLAKFIKPSLYLSGLSDVIKLWQESDAKERGILLLTFAPMLLCLGGFVFTIIHFVLFVLPSFLFSLLGWGLLSTLFGYGGKYLYKHLTGHEIKASGQIDPDIIDVQYKEEIITVNDDDDEEEEITIEDKPKKKRRKNDTDDK